MRQAKIFRTLRFIYEDDTQADQEFFAAIFLQMVELFGRPFRTPEFHFSETKYFNSFYKFGEDISSLKAFRDSKKARGVKDVLYINRTYYGLFNLLHQFESEGGYDFVCVQDQLLQSYQIRIEGLAFNSFYSTQI